MENKYLRVTFHGIELENIFHGKKKLVLFDCNYFSGGKYSIFHLLCV